MGNFATGRNAAQDWRIVKDASGHLVRRSQTVTDRYVREGHWTQTTLADDARERVSESPQHVLAIEGNGCVTREQAWNDAMRLVTFFMDRGLRPGDTISFQLPNWSEALSLALAARIYGLVINPVPPIYRQSEVGFILQDCRSRMLFVPAEFRGFGHGAMAVDMLNDLPLVQEVVTLRGSCRGAIDWDVAMARSQASDGDLPQIDASSVMLAMYTSGTTSRPKGVLHSHQTYGFKPGHMKDVWRLTEDDIVFMPSPISHINGLFWAIDVPWRFGLTSVLLDIWSAEVGLEYIDRFKCTVSGGPTPFLQQMIDRAQTGEDRLSSLRIFFCGGASISADLIRKAGEAQPNCLFVRAYGSTESPTSSMGTADCPEALRLETDGAVIEPTEIRLVSPDTKEDVATGEEGEILVRGPEQFLGYVNPSDNDGAFDGDWFQTGDLGTMVGSRHLRITGRKKDIIIRSGENISPKEVEDLLLGHPGIADIAIVAMPSPTTGEKACAFIVEREGYSIGLAEIREFLEGKGIARQKFPEHVETIKVLPRVEAGKVRKDVLRDEARRIADAQAG